MGCSCGYTLVRSVFIATNPVIKVKLRRIPFDVRAVSAKQKATKEIFTTERIQEETRNSLAAKLTRRHKNKSQVTHK